MHRRRVIAMPKLSSHLKILATAVLGGLALAGCGNSDSADGETTGEPQSGGTLTYASGDAEPDCLDPHYGGNYPQGLIATQYLETLFTKDEDGQTIPWLAETSEVSDDGLTHTISVTDGITFHDDTPLTSEAIKANIEHLQDPETASSTGFLAVEKVEEVEIVDELTADLHLSAPDNALEESLSMHWTAIQSPEALARDVQENCADPVGTGPFMFDSWEREQQVNLVRNDDYVLPVESDRETDQAYLDGITWRMIPEAATRYAALQSGEVDVIDNAQPDTIQSAEDANIGHLDSPRPGAANRLELNSSQAPFDDVLVREAFMRSVDVDGGIEALYFDTAPRSHSLLSSVEPLGYSDESLFTQDVEQANELLDDAGWTERDDDDVRMKDGERLEIVMPVSTNQSVPAEQSLFEQFQSQSAEVGFDMQINLLDLSSWYAALGEHNYDLVSAPYTKVGPSVLRILYHSDSIEPAPSGYFANNAQVNIPELDETLVQAEETTDDDERAELYEQAQRTVLEDHYVLPLYDQQNHFLYSADVQNMGDTSAIAAPEYYNVWLDQ
ncbi:MAG: ABC transporter substrate-binding protein [Yaniella sp.]|uniref:ABC transporter substrate-binding protein n=2 Tax=Yaniella sp. TaxID=2773929 RepID=UPI002649241E|nr:ABC transporter substrate-binding protein [Yaniella sp.]MDN5814631.1 ABC transporter substrate-binding protein [Yaniella sp.]MDN5837093.1 ABC transporter substrate-binding protein [Yaniella sp.]MDN5888320.1 ABC transporter substrate-binding protein [Yaniella sp.]MDN6519871.1 ABC transporter substrate-binding protein [Yaniella sp.]MDN6637281.1 ABC transporter substrate-binding protein [Yaniella sp.]